MCKRKREQRNLCVYCSVGDIATCAVCLQDVCSDTGCLTSFPNYFCSQCDKYWCGDCLQAERYCHYCDIDHCPSCDPVSFCLLCESAGENTNACVLCCKKHNWSRVGFGWVCEDDHNACLAENLISELYAARPLIVPTLEFSSTV